MKIRTRVYLMGLLPSLLVAVLLTAYHLHTRLANLDIRLQQQGMTMARDLASSAEYGVISGNKKALGRLLDQAMSRPDVASAMVVWPDQPRLARGELISHLPPLRVASTWIDDKHSWFAHPVKLSQLDERDFMTEEKALDTAPLAWVVVSIDLYQKQVLARELLVGSLGITLLGLTLATLLIHKLALTGLKPLLNIISTVKRISAGNFGTHMEATAHSPELRELQSMVNQMSDSLRSYQQDMEAKVQQVTAELNRKKMEAEQASRAKSRFLAMASHDLRQPMHAISLYMESLKPQMHGRAAQDTLNKIECSILSTVELFNAILDVTKLDAGVVQPHIGPVRIRKLLLQLADEFAVEADEKNLSLRVRATDVWVESDGILLERIFRNLISNALTHTTRGGVLLSARRYQGQLRLQIWDTGSGIAPEDQLRVFEEFFQGGTQETKTQGMGLGLAIVSRLSRLLVHPLQLHSRLGQGSVFSLEVPLLEKALADLDESGEKSSETLKGSIVIVNDDPSILNALGSLLRQWGMQVKPLHTLHQVMHELQVPPDVVLADFQLLNGETGLMVAREVHTRWGEQIPCVLITGDTSMETLQTLRQSGFPFLCKPVNAHQLRVLITTLLQGRPGVRAGA